MARRNLTLLLAAINLSAAPAILPLNFELNQGQAGPEARFVAQGNGYRLLLTPSGVVLQLAQGTARLMLAGAQPSPEVVGVDKLPGKANYILGNDPALWRTSIPTFARVRYRKAYPGVDLVFYGNGKHLEFDFEVAPGADPKVIRLAFEGETQVKLNGTGDLVLSFGQEQIQLRRPTVYQGTRRTVEGRYRLTGRNVAFEIGDYDRALPLVIDPVLEYSTFLGGRNGDGATAVAVDRSGNVYVTGHTRTDQLDFPLSNPMQATPAGWQAAFVAKLNASGTELVYSTYLGGLAGRGWSPVPGGPLSQASSFAAGIAVDAAGNAYITGTTTDSDFPNMNPAQRFWGGKQDAFVTKLNSLGAVVYSTFIGGPDYDSSLAIAVDRVGRAYIVGTTGGNFPLVGGLQTSHPNNGGFVSRLNPVGTAFEYSTRLSGTSPRGIAVDLEGNAYITGSGGVDLPVTNALQEHPGLVPVYRTSNGGTNWERAYRGLPGSPQFLVVDPHSPSTVYAGLRYGGLFRSTDGGDSWRSVQIVDPSLVLGTLAIDPWTPNTLYTGYANFSSSGPPGGLYKSTDGGATWREILQSDRNVGVFALAIDPSNPLTLYAAQGWVRGVLKSSDGGKTWSPTGLVGYVLQLLVDPDEPSTIFAVWNELAENRNVLVKSTDGGENWSRTGSDTRSINTVVYDRQSRVFYALSADAIVKSGDRGATWEEIYQFRFPDGYSYAAGLTLGPGEPAVIYATDRSVVIKSTDGGRRWEQTSIALPVSLLAAHPSQPGVLYAGAEATGDAFLAKLSANGQALIYATYLGGSGSDSGYAVAVDSEGSAYVTGKTSSPDFLGMKTLRPPANASWLGDAFVIKVNPAGSAVVYAKALGGTGDDVGQAIAVDDAGNAFIAGQSFSRDFPIRNAVQALPPGPLYRSGDGGANWSDASKGLVLGEVKALAVNPSAPLTVYAGGYGGVSKSEDGGATWKATGLTESDIQTLALDPRASATVWAGGASGVFRSTDGGAAWGRADDGLPGGLVKVLVVDPEQSSTVYAGAEGGIFKTTDAGKNWALINRTRWSRNDVYALSISSTTPPVLYAVWGGYYSGIAFKSSDRGATWTSVNLELYVDGSPGEQIAAAVDPSEPSAIYAASPYEMLKSTDGGSKWTPLRIPLDSTFPPSCSAQSLVMARSQPATLYVGGHRGYYWNSEGDCMLRSTDGGESWSLESGPGGITIGAMAVGGPGILYAVGEEGGQAFATKLDPRGDVVFSTFLGGRSIDSATGIAVDPSGGVWVAGFTTSTDFPTQKPFQGQLTGRRDRYSGGDAFLLKIKE